MLEQPQKYFYCKSLAEILVIDGIIKDTVIRAVDVCN